MVGRGAKFIDMRIDSLSMGNVVEVDVPLVADVAMGLDDLTAAVGQLMTPAVKQKGAAGADETRRYHEKARELRNLVKKNPDWGRRPSTAQHVKRKGARFAH